MPAGYGQHPVGVTSMIDGRPSALPASDPSGAGASWVERDVLVAPYNDLDTTQRILSEHAQELSAKAARNPKISLSIFSDKRAPVEQLFKVMDAAKAAGIKSSITAATKTPGQP